MTTASRARGPGGAGGPGRAATVGGVLASTAARLRRTGIENPRREARLLLAFAVGIDEATIVGYPERPVSEADEAALGRLATRRAEGEPLSRILGRREFWSLDFALTAETLDPRPDSETLVEVVLARVSDRGRALRLLDLGTGSGCLLLALLSELPHAFGVGVDLSPGACAAASANARSLGMDHRSAFLASDWASAVSASFDIVVSNPPYVPTPGLETLPPEVRDHDPALALAGGPDGLDAYRRIGSDLRRLLGPDGFAAIEVGAGQSAPVGELMAATGLGICSVHRDLAGIERCLLLELGNRRFLSEKGFQKAGRTTTVIQGLALHSG